MGERWNQVSFGSSCSFTGGRYSFLQDLELSNAGESPWRKSREEEAVLCWFPSSFLLQVVYAVHFNAINKEITRCIPSTDCNKGDLKKNVFSYLISYLKISKQNNTYICLHFLCYLLSRGRSWEGWHFVPFLQDFLFSIKCLFGLVLVQRIPQFSRLQLGGDEFCKPVCNFALLCDTVLLQIPGMEVGSLQTSVTASSCAEGLASSSIKKKIMQRVCFNG